MDLFAIILLCVMLWGLGRRHGDRFLTDQRVFEWLLLTNLVTLLFDSATCLLDGQVFPGSHMLGVFATFGYYAMNPVMGLVYLLYCEVKLGVPKERMRRRLPFYCLPAALHLMLTVLSLFRPVLFDLAPDNDYSRGPLFPASMILSYATVFYAILETILFMVRGKRQGGTDHRLCRSLLVFPIPPLIGGLFQIATPEVSIVWASTVISMLILFINLQNAEITTDTLTGLFNRGPLMPYLDGKLHKPGSSGNSLSIILLDLNDFKQINDSFGHLTGDAALQRTAAILRQSCSREDFIARYGGDEFILIVEREIASDVPALIEHIRAVMAQFNQRGEEPYTLSVSAGYARWEDGYETIDDFIAAADERMYEEKRSWRNGPSPIGTAVK